MKLFFLVCGGVVLATWLYLCVAMVAAACIGTVRSRRNREQWQNAGSVADQVWQRNERQRKDSPAPHSIAGHSLAKFLGRILQ